MSLNDSQLTLIWKALRFAAAKHSGQVRKDQAQSPYINHPIEVMDILWDVGEVRDVDILIAALLHDTIEDTDCTAAEIEALFGKAITDYVLEVTDDKSLSKEERKRLQVENAPHKSDGAKQIKIADKASNLHDIVYSSPIGWPLQRRQGYLDWANAVVAGLRGVNPKLERHYDAVAAEAERILRSR